jgi:hypothetical protein
VTYSICKKSFFKTRLFIMIPVTSKVPLVDSQQEALHH